MNPKIVIHHHAEPAQHMVRKDSRLGWRFHFTGISPIRSFGRGGSFSPGNLDID